VIVVARAADAHAARIDLAFPSDASYALTEGAGRAPSGKTLYKSDASRPGRDNTVRRLLLVLGLLALAVGLLWIGQGTGVITWPQSSFMIKQLQWAGYGAALSALGLVLIWQARR